MAYKFQIGAAKLAGATTFDDAMTVSSNVTLNADLALSAGVVDNAELANDSVTVAGKTVALGSSILLDTDDVSEGSNLYYTDARAQAAISVSGDLSYNAGVVHFSMSAHNTDDLAEGSSNLYWTVARGESMFDSKLAAADTDDLSEGASNLYYTDARVQAALSAGAGLAYDGAGQFSLSSSVAGDGLSYSAGVLAVDFAEINSNLTSSVQDILADASSQDEILSHLSGGAMIDLSAGGVISVNTAEYNTQWDVKMAAADTDDLAEGASSLYFTDARARAAISVTDNGGDGSLSYDSSTGVITYTGPSAAEVQAHFSAGSGIGISSGVISITGSSDDLTEGSTNLFWTVARGESMFDSKLAAADTDDLSEGASNLYFTDARARGAISVTDAGGDGSLSYDSSTGVITYTGPSAAEARAHLSVVDNSSAGRGELSYDSSTGVFTYEGISQAEVRGDISGGTGVTYSAASGVISIGQAVGTSDSVSFASASLSGDLTVAGDLTVEGALTYIDTTNLQVADNEIILNKGGTLGAGNTAGIRFEDTSTGAEDVIFQWEGTDNQFQAVDSSGAFLDIRASNFIGFFQGAMAESIQTINADASASAQDGKSIILMGHNSDVTLPAAADAEGVVVKIKNYDRLASASEPCVINAASGEQVEGASSISLPSPGAAVMVVSDGSAWHVM